MRISRKLQPFVDWLDTRGVSASAAVRHARAALAAKGKHIPARYAGRYTRKVVLGTFISTFISEGRRKKALNPRDMDLFEIAILLSLDAKAFSNRLPEFARPHSGEYGRLRMHDSQAFEAWVQDNGRRIAKTMLRMFRSRGPDSGRPALAYLEKAAVSQYVRGTLLTRDRYANAGTLSYIERSRRLSERLRLAYKLVYLPMALSKRESRTLRQNYRWKLDATTVRTVGDVASKLQFPSAAALSRRLYKVRQWARTWEQRRQDP